jgi:hypothetical protein
MHLRLPYLPVSFSFSSSRLFRNLWSELFPFQAKQSYAGSKYSSSAFFLPNLE